jgi:hypothetical protein
MPDRPPEEDAMKDIEEIEESEEEAEDLEDVEDEEREEEAPPAPTTAPGEEGEVESSLEELLAKKEPRPAEEEEEDESILTVEREERLEPLAVKVVPPQPTEFVCSNCHLVKHRSQLARREKGRVLCRDCA